VRGLPFLLFNRIQMIQKPAFIIAATKSGAGKTTLTLGIMSALVKRGYHVQPYKCGPDFIDPTLHKTVTGNFSYNIDLRMMGGLCCRQTFNSRGEKADILILEGVMGLFDGGDSSTASVAKELNVPVFLIIDAQSSAESAAAVLKGFELYDPQVKLAGVIFNKIGSPRHRELIASAVRTTSSVPVIGYMPREQMFQIPERHLGLYMGNENPLDEKSLDSLASSSESYLDIDQMIASRSPVVLPEEHRTCVNKQQVTKSIAVSIDEAFCFYYQQNLELFNQEGFEVVPFSPLHDKSLPSDVDMIYLCGGYPENFAADLALNRSMLESINEAHHRDIPIYAECGGFMYLCKTLTDNAGKSHEMVGIFNFHTTMNSRLRRLGYRQVTLRRDCLLGRKGDTLHGHEFHYSDILSSENDINKDKEIECLYSLDNNSYEGYSCRSTIGSYVHLHFGQTPGVLRHLSAKFDL
jgi:cobyrinic acid a,c-diamide synthase